MLTRANIEVRPVKKGTVSFKAPMQRECCFVVCSFIFLANVCVCVCFFFLFYFYTSIFGDDQMVIKKLKDHTAVA